MPSLVLRSRTSNPHGGGAGALTASDIDRYDRLAEDFATFFESRPDAGMNDFVIGRHLRFLGSGEARVVFRDKLRPKRVVKLNWDDPDQTLKEIQVWNEAPAWLRPHLVPVLGYDRGGRWAVYEYAEPMPADTARDEWAGVDNEVARRLADCGLGDAVAQNLSKDGRLLDYGWFDPVLWGRCAQRRNPAASSAASRAAFRRWFGQSTVVDADGAPLVVYHGTTAGGFDAFRPNYRKGEQLGFGIHFAQDRGFAAKYAEDPTVARKGKKPKVYAVYLSIQRPLVADAIVYEGTPEFALAKKLAGSKLMTQRGEDGVRLTYMQNAIDKTSALRAEKLIREAGYDGIVYESVLSTASWTGTGVGRAKTGSSRSYIVFEPTQVKSATDNAGTFDPAELSILRNPPRKPAYSESELARLEEEKSRASEARQAAWGKLQAVVRERVLRLLQKLPKGAYDEETVARDMRDYTEKLFGPEGPNPPMSEYPLYIDAYSAERRATGAVDRYSEALYKQLRLQAIKRARAGEKNLRDADLRNANLRGVDLSGVNLTEADLIAANLSGANLSGANLQGASLLEANLTRANLTGANLQGADLASNLIDANLSGANLQNATLRQAKLKGATLQDANLSGADLWGAILKGANLTGANLESADLDWANLEGANLKDANLEDAKIRDTTNLTGANLKGVNLKGTTLEGRFSRVDGTLLVRPARAYGKQTGAVLKLGKADAPSRAVEFKRRYPAEFERLKGDTSGADFTDAAKARIRTKYETPFKWFVTEGWFTSDLQRYCPYPNLVFMLNLDLTDAFFTERQRAALKSLAKTSRISKHPHETGNLFTVGWVRLCVNDATKTWLVEEVQSDVGIIKGDSVPEGRKKRADVTSELRPYIDRFYEDALGIVFMEAEKRGYSVEMLEYASKRQFNSPRAVYTDLPRSMGMVRQKGSNVLRDQRIAETWFYKPNPAEPRYTLLGVDEEVTTCEHCGKADLKCTVVLGVLDADGNVEREARFGRSCAAKALRKPSTTTANKMESLARVAEFKRVWAMRVDGPGKREQVAAGRFPIYVTSYPLTDGRTLLLQESDPSFRPPAGAWTRLREGAWVGHPAKTNPSRSRARR